MERVVDYACNVGAIFGFFITSRNGGQLVDAIAVGVLIAL